MDLNPSKTKSIFLHVYPLWWWHSSHFSLLYPSSLPFFPQALGLISHALGSASTGSSTPVARSSPSTLESHPLSFSSLSSPQFSPSSSHPSPVLTSLPIPSPPLPTLLASLHSLLLHLCQVAQCFMSCPCLVDITCNMCLGVDDHNHHFPLLVAVI